MPLPLVKGVIKTSPFEKGGLRGIFPVLGFCNLVFFWSLGFGSWDFI
jgi:hypothetical protein